MSHTYPSRLIIDKKWNKRRVSHVETETVKTLYFSSIIVVDKITLHNVIPLSALYRAGSDEGLISR